MEKNVEEKKAKTYTCITCNYICIKKNHYENHLNTKKHKEKTNGEIIIKNVCICGKKMNNRQGLYRHKKVCNYKPIENLTEEPIEEPNYEKLIHEPSEVPTEESIEKPTEEVNQQNIFVQANINIFLDIIKENQEIKKLLIEQNKQVIELHKENNELINKFMEREQVNNNSNNTINNQTNNQTFNLNFFLNETCKDAMNVKEFLDNLNPTVDDLENVGEKGFVKGISEIILKSLRGMEITKRPIHCTDIKREVVYLKEDDKWNKDDTNNSKMKELIRRVENKNFSNIYHWQQMNPNVRVLDSPEYNKQLLLMDRSGEAINNEDRVRGKVLKELLKEIHINGK